jgi:putative aminopeptidase FrvX
MQAKHEKYLLELTGLPTATGCEQQVIAWVERWARRRKTVDFSRDRFGNLLLKRAGARSRNPIYFTAHMDHPAFVVVKQQGPRVVLAEFRGGVEDRYFVGSRVRLHIGDGDSCPGRVTRLQQAKKPKPGTSGPGADKRAVIELAKPTVAEPGDILTWNLPAPKVAKGLLRAPACDDLAGVAAAIAAFEVLNKRPAKHSGPDVRVLLTRAEEVGFIGAIAACKSGIIPKAARLVALETSKSFADSPIGGGPIVRVGDRTSSFDPDLTYRVGQVAQHIQQLDPAFNWQRKLMPGGTCEATAFQALGFTATCLCLPLGNYHNMNADDENTKGRVLRKHSGQLSGSEAGRVRIDSEVISLADYHGLVRLLIEIGRSLDRGLAPPPLKDRLNKLFAQRRGLLG